MISLGSRFRVPRWLPATVWAGCIFVASSIPGSSYPDVGESGLDKVVHFIVFGVLSAAVYGGLRAHRGKTGPLTTPARALLWAVLLTTAYGALDELHQRAVPGRFSDLVDLLADAVGGVCGAALILGFERLRARRRD